MDVIADEVFLDYEMNDATTPPSRIELSDARRVGHESFLNESFAGSRGTLTFTLSGLSKISGLPQMKAAWIVLSGPDSLVEEASARLEVIADTYLSPNAPVQWALPEMLATRKGNQEQLMDRVRTNLATLADDLRKQSMCQRLDVEGGWYAVLRVPVTQSDEELAIQLLERESVLMQPGHFYDFASDGYLVVSLITPEDVFRVGVRKVMRFLAR